MIAKSFKLKLHRQIRTRFAYCLTWDRPEHRYLEDIQVFWFGCKSIHQLTSFAELWRGMAERDDAPLAGEFMGGTSCGASMSHKEALVLFAVWMRDLNLAAGCLVLHFSRCGRVDFHLFTPNIDHTRKTLRARGVLTHMRETVRPLISALNQILLERGDFAIGNTTARGKVYFAELPRVTQILEIAPAAPPPPAPAVAIAAPAGGRPLPSQAAPAVRDIPPANAPARKPAPRAAEPPPQPQPPPPPVLQAPAAGAEEEERKRREKAEEARQQKLREAEATRLRVIEQDDAERNRITELRRKSGIRPAIYAFIEHRKRIGDREIPELWYEREVRELHRSNNAGIEALIYKDLVEGKTPTESLPTDFAHDREEPQPRQNRGDRGLEI